MYVSLGFYWHKADAAVVELIEIWAAAGTVGAVIQSVSLLG